MEIIHVLFFNHKVQSCGVYQYGVRIYEILKKSNLINYIYCEIEDYTEYINYVSSISHNKIIYNYHSHTMRWLKSSNIQNNVQNIAIPHESDYSMFDVILNINPTEPEKENHYSIPRPIYENVDKLLSNYKIENPEVESFIKYKNGDKPIFGSFGFGFNCKGFDKLVSIVNNSCSHGIIKLLIPTPFFTDSNYENICKGMINRCVLNNTNPNVELIIIRTLFTNEEVLMFLSSNTANIFMYDKMNTRSASSVIDYAISVNVPIVISDSNMFRHIYSDDICIYKNSLNDCINNSRKILPILLARYSNNNLIDKVDRVIIDSCNISTNACVQSYKVDVSFGEIIDKYSILDLKTRFITDNAKLIEINKEMKTLSENVDVKKYPYFYKLLVHINKLIWLDTDIIKGLNLDSTAESNNVFTFAETSNRIFENNQKRFRLKQYFNILRESNIKEQKSYGETKCYINILDEDEIYNKISELNYLFICYDAIYINIDYTKIISKLFTNPNIKFINPLYPIHTSNVNNETVSDIKNYNITSFFIPENEQNVYDYEPIKYISAGRLGDFINQLSIVCENFYETGRKGVLYIVDKDFTYDINHTYSDTYDTIINEKYIKDYQIYKGETYDINLSSWRSNFTYSETYKNIFDRNYNVDWARHNWITPKFDNKWKHKHIIYITPYRFLSQSAYDKLYNIITPENFVFITMNKSEYEYFINSTRIQIDCYMIQNFDELVTIISSCKSAYLGMTSFGAIANALRKEFTLIGKPGNDYNNNKFLGILPNVVDEFV
jgi:hypothetical protein